MVRPRGSHTHCRLLTQISPLPPHTSAHPPTHCSSSPTPSPLHATYSFPLPIIQSLGYPPSIDDTKEGEDEWVSDAYVWDFIREQLWYSCSFIYIQCTYCIRGFICPCTYCIRWYICHCTYCIRGYICHCTYCIRGYICPCTYCIRGYICPCTYLSDTHGTYLVNPSRSWQITFSGPSPGQTMRLLPATRQSKSKTRKQLYDLYFK